MPEKEKKKTSQNTLVDNDRHTRTLFQDLIVKLDLQSQLQSQQKLQKHPC